MPSNDAERLPSRAADERSEEGTKRRSRLAVGCKAGLGVMGASPYDFKSPETSAILTMQHGPQALRLRDVQLRELPLGTIHLHTD